MIDTQLKWLALILCASSLISSCVSISSQMQFDDKTQYQPILNNKYSRSLLNVEMDLALDNQVLLRVDYNQNKRYLDILIMKGAQKCYPALVDELRTREQRIKSELYSGLKHDAANDLIVQRHKLEVLNLKLSDVLSKGACHPSGPLYHEIRVPKLIKAAILKPAVLKKPAKKKNNSDKKIKLIKKAATKAIKSIKKKSTKKIKPTMKVVTKDRSMNILNKQLVLKQLGFLLNSDNMFAYDSAKINPKYSARLDEASIILKKYLAIHIKINGRTDTNGGEKYNQLLSKKRAKTVQKYLIDQGISVNRMMITSVALSRSYEDSRGSEYRLANRRVDIKVWFKK